MINLKLVREINFLFAVENAQMFVGVGGFTFLTFNF